MSWSGDHGKLRRPLFLTRSVILPLAFVVLRTAVGASLVDGVAVETTGTMRVGDVRMDVVFFSDKWRCSRQAGGAAHVDPALASATEWSAMGTFSPSDQTRSFAFVQKMSRVDPRTMRYSVRMTCPDGIAANQLAFALCLPVATHRGGRVMLDGRAAELPAEPLKGSINASGVKRVVVFTTRGKLTFEGNLRVSVQDGRNHKSKEHFRVRLLFSESRGMIRDSQLGMTMRYEPYPCAPVDMSKQANMGFRDEVEGDGEGGWTDQGENDIRMLRPGTLKACGLSFRVLDPGRNSGKSCLVFAGPQREYLLKTAALPAPGGEHEYLYLLHATAWTPKTKEPAGTVRVEYADGTQAEHAIVCGQDVGNWFQPLDLPNGVVAWTGANQRSKIGLYLSKLKLRRKPVQRLQLTGSGRAVWMVVAAIMGEDVPMFKTDGDEFIVQDANWAPLEHMVKTKPESVLDWSFMSDGPAGKHGWVVVRNGRFEFERRPGDPLRFYGGNLCSRACYPDKEQAESLAAELALRGYNTVRIHHYDRDSVVKSGPKSTVLDAANMDKLDYLFHCLKQRGLYISIDLYTVRVVKRGEIPEVDRNVRLQEFKALVPVSPSAMQNWKDFSKNLLNHRNPYTGLAWKDDPALFSICLLNEDNTYVHWDTAPDIRAIYEKRFAEWLSSKGVALKSEDERSTALIKFLYELNTRMFEECTRHVRGLGVKALLTDANYRQMIHVGLLRRRMDYVDNHGYWDLKRFLAAKWRLPYGHHQRVATENLASMPRGLMPSRLFGKPYTVTEYQFCYPNHRRAEGGPLMGAYAALQDWDGVYRYAYSHQTTSAHEPGRTFYLDYVTDPLNLMADRITTALFGRRDVAPAKTTIPFLFTDKCLDEPGPFDRKLARAPDEFSQLGLYARIGSIDVTNKRRLTGDYPFAVSREALPTSLLPGKPMYRGDSLLARGLAPRAAVDPDKKRFTSETGEIVLDGAAGTFRVVTERTESFVLPRKGMASGRHVRVNNHEGFAVVAVISVDGKPIPQSTRLLVLHLTDVQNCAVHFGDKAHTVLRDWGRLPHLIRRGSASVSVERDSGDSTRAWAVDMSGARRKPIRLDRREGSVAFTASTIQPDGAFMAYELAVECRRATQRAVGPVASTTTIPSVLPLDAWSPAVDNSVSMYRPMECAGRARRQTGGDGALAFQGHEPASPLAVLSQSGVAATLCHRTPQGLRGYSTDGCSPIGLWAKPALLASRRTRCSSSTQRRSDRPCRCGRPWQQ